MFLRRLAAIVLVGMLPTFAIADNLKISGPYNVDEGKIVHLSVSGVGPNDGIWWDIDPIDTTLPDPDFGMGGDRQQKDLEFTGKAGVYKVSVSVVSLMPNGKFSLRKIKYNNVTIGKAPPVPPTPNPPGPSPGPPTPPPEGTGSAIVVIADESNPTSAQTNITNGPTLASYKAAGKCWIFGNVSDSETITRKKYDKMMSDAKLTAPAMFVLDKTGKAVYAAKLPTDEASLSSVLKERMSP